MKKTLDWLWEEFYSALPCIIFFFVIFNLADFTKLMVFKKWTTTGYNFLVILTASLVMGKVMVISNHLPFIGVFSGKPLIYSTLWKTFIYFICSLLVRLIERLAPFVFREKSWADVQEKIMDSMAHTDFWIVQMWLFVLLLIFVAYAELISQVGRDKVWKMFFG